MSIPYQYPLPSVPISTSFCTNIHFLLYQYPLPSVPISTSLCTNIHFLMYQYPLPYVPISTSFCTNIHFLMYQYPLPYVPISTSLCTNIHFLMYSNSIIIILLLYIRKWILVRKEVHTLYAGNGHAYTFTTGPGPNLLPAGPITTRRLYWPSHSKLGNSPQ